MIQKVSFTKKELLAVTPPDGKKRTYIHNTGTPSSEPGLLLQITPKGRKTFQFYRWFRKPISINLGLFPSMSVERARLKARECQGKMDDGINPADEKREARQEMTFKELFEIYMERHAKPRKRSWQDDLTNFRLYLEPLGKKRLSEVRKNHIASIHSKIGRAHKVTANRVLVLISSVFGRGIEYGLWENINPCWGIRKFPEKSRVTDSVMKNGVKGWLYTKLKVGTYGRQTKV